jgi:hypothetical protein
VVIKDPKDILLYGTVSVDVESDDKWFRVKSKLNGVNLKAGTVEAVGDVYLDGVKVEENDIVPPITNKNNVKAICFFQTSGVIHIVVLIYFIF